MALDATVQPAKLRSVTTENRIARFTLIAISLIFLLLILLLPLAAVFVEAFRKGLPSSRRSPIPRPSRRSA